jgi:hypothetical protein
LRRLEMSRKTFLVAITVLTVAVGVAIRPQVNTSAPNNRALTAVRLINTAEASVRQAQARYVPLAELVSSGALKRAAEMNADFSSAFPDADLKSGTLVPGFDLAIVVSSDGGAYKLSIAAKDDCGAAYFTDQRGVIYSGRALGCPANP